MSFFEISNLKFLSTYHIVTPFLNDVRVLLKIFLREEELHLKSNILECGKYKIQDALIVIKLVAVG